jgi:hypothetical protein
VCGLLPQVVWAAASGWYQLDATWLNGSFSGQFQYDSSSSYGIVAVQGTLTDVAQTTAISTVVYPESAADGAWVFLANSNPAEVGGHDAGFYLYLLEQGGKLVLDTSASNSLYDWSSDYAYFDQLNESPLQSYTITAVPEPASAAMLLGGLALLAGVVRRRQAVG